MTGLSPRGAGYLRNGGLERIRQLLGDLYDRDTNPGGIINLGTAENVYHTHALVAIMLTLLSMLCCLK